MAIIKDYSTKFGIVAPYHRISQINMNQENVEILVHTYASQEARDLGASHLWAEYVIIPFKDLTVDPRDLFYPLLEQYSGSYLKDGLPHIPPGVSPHPPVFGIVAPPPPVVGGIDPVPLVSVYSPPPPPPPVPPVP